MMFWSPHRTGLTPATRLQGEHEDYSKLQICDRELLKNRYIQQIIMNVSEIEGEKR